MNVGIAAARNEIIVRADAHTRYASDYVSASVASLLRTSALRSWAARCGPSGITPFGRAVAAVTSSPFGVGPGRFHYAMQLEEVDTVYLGTFRKSTVARCGRVRRRALQWAAEDQELNFSIRQRRRPDPPRSAIRSQYFPRQTPRALLRQYHNYGLCKASTLAKHRTLPYWRPVAPAVVVGATVVWTIVALARRRPRALSSPWSDTRLGRAGVALRLSRERGVTPHRALAALAICHWGYGAGLWRGLGRIVTGRPFDNRPPTVDHAVDSIPSSSNRSQSRSTKMTT